jgi:hypothetical protein
MNVLMDGIPEKFYPFNGKSERLIGFGKSFGEKIMETMVETDL